MDPTEDAKVVQIEKKSVHKKKHTGLIISLICTAVTLITPIAVVFGCFYDGKRADMNATNKITKEQAMMNAAVDSLDNTKDTGKVSFVISEETFNNMIIDQFENVKADSRFDAIRPYVKGFSLETSNDSFNFVADLEAYGFKTRLKIVTKLDQDDDNYYFWIKDFVLGRVGGFGNLFGAQLNAGSLLDLFTSFGLSFTADTANNRIVYAKSDVQKDIVKYLNSSNEDNLYNSLLNEFFSNKCFTMEFNKIGMVGYIDLQEMAKNDSFLDESKTHSIDWSSYKDKLQTLLKNKIISLGDAEHAYTFLIKGNINCSNEDKNVLVDRDLSSIGITDLDSYNGVFTPEASPEEGKIIIPAKDIKATVQDRISLEQITTNRYISEITEEDLNKTFASSKAIGTTYALARKYYEASDTELANPLYKFNTFTVSDMYCNIVGSSIKIVIDINANGYSTYVCVNANFQSSDDYVLTFDLSDIAYGSRVASTSFKNAIFDLIKQSFSDKDGAFSFDSANKKLIIDVTDSVEDSGYKATIDAMGEPGIEAVNNSKLSDDGKFLIIVKQINI